MNLPGGSEWLIILLIVALIFGAAKLPKLARSIGQAKGEFEKGMREGEAASAAAAADEAKAEDKPAEKPAAKTDD